MRNVVCQGSGGSNASTSPETSKIFASTAPAYWDAGLSVIPLYFRAKNPQIYNWSRYADVLPNTTEQELWTRMYPANNIGLALGPQSGLAVMDVDTNDPQIVAAILKVLPPSPWKRIGKKGMVLAYKYTGMKTFRIKDDTGTTLVEFLSRGTQVVIPPSIHPETQQPYQANVELLDVLDKLMPLPEDIETTLRDFLQLAGVKLSHSGWSKITDWVAAGARDVQMTKQAGLLAFAVLKGDATLLEAIDHMSAWCESRVEKVAGDDVKVEKGIQNIITFLSRDVMEKKKVLPIGWDTGLTPEQKEQMGLSFTEDNEEWDYERIKNFIREVYERHEEGSQARINGVETALAKLAKNTKPNAMLEDMLLTYIATAGGMGMTVGSIRRRKKELAQGEVKGNDHTELAKAVLADLKMSGDVIFAGGQFRQWGGSHWEVLPRAEIMAHIANEYGDLPAARRSSDHKGIVDVLASLTAGELNNTDGEGVNFINGFVRRDGVMVPHDPKYGMTYTLGYRYMPEEARNCTGWLSFLERVWGHEPDYYERVAALQEAMCVTIFGMGPKFERAILLHGPGKTGKSQMLAVVSSLLPPEARSSCPPNKWGDKFAPATMFGKLLNLCGELPERDPIAGDIFKGVITGESIQAQFKNQPLFDFRPIATHWFASNHLPKTRDTSDGFTRRWLILSFNRPIKASEQQSGFGDNLVALEREAIAAWAIDALPRVTKQVDYNLPSSHTGEIERVAQSNNSVRHFLKRSPLVRLREGAIVLEDKIFIEYRGFCVQKSLRSVGSPEFKNRMRELGPELGIAEGIGGWGGVEIIPQGKVELKLVT